MLAEIFVYVRSHAHVRLAIPDEINLGSVSCRPPSAQTSSERSAYVCARACVRLCLRAEGEC